MARRIGDDHLGKYMNEGAIAAQNTAVEPDGSGPSAENVSKVGGWLGMEASWRICITDTQGVLAAIGTQRPGADLLALLG